MARLAFQRNFGAVPASKNPARKHATTTRSSLRISASHLDRELRILEMRAGLRAERKGGAAARVDDVLKIRLGGPSVADLILVHRRDQPVEASHRPRGQDKPLKIKVKPLRPFRTCA